MYTKDKAYDFSYRFSWFHLIRPMTLTGTITPVLAGTAIAAKRGHLRIDLFILTLLAAFFVQASINMLNDYFDFKGGQDQEKWVAAGNHGPRLKQIPYVAIACMIGASLIGLCLAYQSSFLVIVIGLVGALLGFSYSAGSRPLCSIGLGEVLAAICMGPVPITITYMVQGLTPDAHIFAISLLFSILVSTMILSNNIRDIQKDQGFRRTLAMILGRKRASQLLNTLLALAYLWAMLLVILGVVSWIALIVLLAIPLALKLRWCYRIGTKRKDEMNGMKVAALHHWAFGLLFALALWLSING